jgi:hypothetical protein
MVTDSSNSETSDSDVVKSSPPTVKKKPNWLTPSSSKNLKKGLAASKTIIIDETDPEILDDSQKTPVRGKEQPPSFARPVISETDDSDSPPISPEKSVREQPYRDGKSIGHRNIVEETDSDSSPVLRKPQRKPIVIPESDSETEKSPPPPQVQNHPQRERLVNHWVLQHDQHFRRRSSSSTIATFKEFVEDEPTDLFLKKNRRRSR